MAKISVIIPAKSEKSDLKKVLYSLLNQNFQDFEILVISDKDIKISLNDPKIRNIRTDNPENIPELLNESIKYINSDLVCFLNQEDLLLYNALELRYIEFLKNHDLTACYGLGFDSDLSYEIKKNQNYEYFFREEKALPENSINSVLCGDIFPSVSSLMIKTKAFRKLEYNTSLDIVYAWDFFIRLFEYYKGNIIQINEPVYISRELNAAIAGNKRKYFINCLKESTKVLDIYFSGQNNSEKLNLDKYYCYKSLYYSFLFLLIEYFPFSYLSRIHLLVLYFQKNSELEGRLFDLQFLSMLLNSLIIAGKEIRTDKKLQDSL